MARMIGRAHRFVDCPYGFGCGDPLCNQNHLRHVSGGGGRKDPRYTRWNKARDKRAWQKEV